jgi:hypothetical protein
MGQKFARHKITVGGLTGTPSSLPFYFLAPEDTYGGLTEASTGVTKITIVGAPNTTDETAPFTTVEALLRSGYAVRKVISYTTGTGATLRRRYARIIVAKNLADSFAPPATIRGNGNVVGVVNPLDATFS